LNQPLPVVIIGSIVAAFAGASVLHTLASAPFRIPSAWLIGAVVVAVGLLGIVGFVWRMRTIAGSARSSVFVGHISLYGTREFEVVVGGLRWRLQVPQQPPWQQFDPAAVGIRTIQIDIPPRCPNCGTELEERPRFWGGYLWSCVKCTFVLKRPNNFRNESERVLKIARRNWELTVQGPDLTGRDTAS
jgi:ribosomal protein L37AE/L43A